MPGLRKTKTMKLQRPEITEYPNLIILEPLGMRQRFFDHPISPVSASSSAESIDSAGSPDQSSATFYCPICRNMFQHFADHIASHWKPDTGVNMDVQHHVMVALYKDHELRLRNWSHQPLLIQSVYLISQFDANCLTAGQVLPKLQPQQDCVFQWRPELESKYGSTTIVVLTETPDGTEYIEWHQLQPCCRSELTSNDRLQKQLLETIHVHHQIMAICGKSLVQRDAFANRMRASFGPDGLTADNYLRFWSLADQLDRAEAQLPLQAYGMFMLWENNPSPQIFSLQIPADQMPVGAPCILNHYDMAVFRDSQGDVLMNGKHSQYANILAVTPQGLVTVKLEGQNACLEKDRLFKVTFIAHSYPADMQLGALKWMDKCGVVPLLFGEAAKLTTPLSTLLSTPPTTPAIGTAEAINRGDLQPDADYEWFSADLNVLQKAAICRLVAGAYYPHPYVLFGPPGTGKTKTLVEAILQLWRRAPNSRMLVCAATNAAADELALRLAPFVSNECHFGHNMYRLYSKSCVTRDPSSDMPQLEGCSNYPDFQTPSWDYLKQFRIVVCTLVVAGSFRYAWDVQATDFSHVIVDESGSSTELAALLPMAVCTDLAGLHAQVVLAGDPKQLGPVLKSRQAISLGAGVSLLERLMQMPAYSKQPDTDAYDKRLITQLVNNYRSHPSIVSIANQAFYDNRLIANGAASRTHRFAEWWRLPVPGTPIIFHSVSGRAQRPRGAHSLYNRDEIDVLIGYIKKLMAGNGITSPRTHPKVQQSDIGVISPYALQCTKIREALRAIGYPDIMVAPVESYQGRERPIILTSTVRSAYSMPGLGFLGCPKRLNVMITRPQSLLIMIGDAYTLRLDPSWRMVLRRFLEMGVCIGKRFDIWPAADERPMYERPFGNIAQLAKRAEKFEFQLPEDLQPISRANMVERLRETELLRKLSIRNPRAHRVIAEPVSLMSAEAKAAMLAKAEDMVAEQLAQKEELRREADEQRQHRAVQCVLGSSITEVARQLVGADVAQMVAHSPVTSSGTSSPASSQASSLNSLGYRRDSSSSNSSGSQCSVQDAGVCEYLRAADGISVCRHCNLQYSGEGEGRRNDAFAGLAEQFVAALPN